MTIFEETAIIDYVEEKGSGLPADLAFVCWREVKELRALLASARKDRADLQERFDARGAKLDKVRAARRSSR